MGVTGILSIIFMSVVLPLIIILHYTTKWKQTRGLGAEEQQMLEELWESTERMESRLNALETILDERSDNWREEI
ncbi:MAG TPA: envelope stress response membrane protein PspB [Gammaproteobacteria bacterium]|jgi:phage shock protein B